MENGKLVVTIAIYMHGTIIKTDLTSEETDIFENVRLVHGTCDFTQINVNEYKQTLINKNMTDLFMHDIDKPTYKLLENIRDDNIVSNITFDKSLSISEKKGIHGFMEEYFYSNFFVQDGIYLISIHKDKKLIYPETKNPINLLNINNLKKISKKFLKKIPHTISAKNSSVLPVDYYLTRENDIWNDNTINGSEREKQLHDIQDEFYNILNKWNFTIKRHMITSIKLSVFINLIKSIISDDCIINLLDLSCNNISKYVPEEQISAKSYALNKYDVENNLIDTKYGGKTTRKNVIKKRKNKICKSRKCTLYFMVK
jgi:hypothetical protein